jgi:hypothetical protein
VKNDTNYFGPNSDVFLKIPSFEDCYELCVQNPLCAFVSYQPSSLICWLKVKGVIAYPYKGMFSAPKFCPGFGE